MVVNDDGVMVIATLEEEEHDEDEEGVNDGERNVRRRIAHNNDNTEVLNQVS